MPIRRPAPIDRIKRRTLPDMSCYQHFDILHVKDKFPEMAKMDVNTAIRQGKMITRRRQILEYRKNHKDRLDPARVQNQEISISSQEHAEHKGTRMDSEGGEPARLAASQAASNQYTLNTTATTVRFENMPPPADGNIKLMLPYAPSVAESKSSMASSYACNDLRLEIPPRPLDSDGNELDEFECPYCFTLKHITTGNSWK